MTFLLGLLHFNDLFASLIGILGNILLFYLILSQTKDNIKKINIILLPNCIVYFFAAFATFLAQPQLFITGNHVYIVNGSGINQNSLNFTSISIWFWGALFFVSLIAVAIPFYLRFLVLCKKHWDTVSWKKSLSTVLFLNLKNEFILRDVKIKTKHFILPYILVFFSFILLFCVLFWWHSLELDANENLKSPLNNSFWLDENKNGVAFIVVENDKPPFYLLFADFVILTGLTFGLIIYCKIKISKTMDVGVSNFSSPEIVIKQLHKTLIFQATLTFVFGIIPIFLIFILSFLKIENIVIPLWISLFFDWIPAIHPIGAVFIIEPYRKRFKHLIASCCCCCCCCCCSENKTSVISIEPQSEPSEPRKVVLGYDVRIGNPYVVKG